MYYYAKNKPRDTEFRPHYGYRNRRVWKKRREPYDKFKS